MGECEHNVKVTHIKGKGWGVRVFVNGNLNQESIVTSRSDISREIGHMLRMEDKCGNISQIASASRERRFCSPNKIHKQVY